MRIPMLSLVYMSTSVRPLSDDELSAILTDARTRNTALEITGVLAHRDGRFIQVLEGPDDAVRERFEVIRRDPRHTDVRLLCEDPLDERAFPGWSMAFQPADADMTAVAGFSDLTVAGRDEHRNASRGRALVEWFRKRPSFT
ncbi:hypothetical protein DEI81_02580 [Curtobacterium sp. MCBD17_013]|nr:hypothetical protein DEI86_00020 [Curtobacterium sp. MCBD17_028]PZE75845.1 hypothetical protein DEI82_08140 [Curtobacterium sp. MCBD17_019]PZF66498.1 hypothetical protein DEI81_02580 [Curtobacterium sp. MCBD17_013]